MENLLKAHSERQQQFSAFNAQLEKEYAELHVQYEHQKQQLVEYKQKANYWEAKFTQIKTREQELLEEIEEVKAKLKKREHQLFGKKSEKGKKRGEKLKSSNSSESKKSRGQQAGSQGHGRRDYSHLPQVDEFYDLAESEKDCPCCGLPFEELATSEDSEVIEIINVQGYTRQIHRKRYKRSCKCNHPTPKIMTAPKVSRLFDKCKFGVSLWAHLLLNKYEYQHPLNRILQQLEDSDLSLAIGTVIGGFRKCIPLLTPIYDAIVNRSYLASHWHADETGWKVFEEIEGKTNSRWYMWIFHNHETVIYKICPSRSSQVLKDHFNDNTEGGILSVDRYSAYKAIAKEGLFLLAFCWAHVRRDFLDYAKGYEHLEAWALEWVEIINELYHINNQRIAYSPKSNKFHRDDKVLKKALKAMRKKLDGQLKDKQLLPSAKKLLISLEKHWDGLTLFSDYPAIPMDNNTAERGLRNPIVGRKGYYGSGSVWSSQLGAAMFTIVKTMKLANLNPHTWLLAYLQECAMNDGSPPDNINKFLPWNMTAKQRVLYSKPPIYENTL